MGVWVDMFISPADPSGLSAQQFIALVQDLIQHDWVETPCAVQVGEFDVSDPLGLVNKFGHNQAVDDQILYRGDNVQALLLCLEAVAWRKTNLCVWFSAFNWQNSQLRDSLEQHGYGNVDILLFALTRPQKLELINAYEGVLSEHEGLDLFVTTGKGGVASLQGSVLEPILVKHLGENLVVNCAFY